jgi:hypothetical protein
MAKFKDYIPKLLPNFRILFPHELLLAFTQIPQMKADFTEEAIN